MRSSAIWRVLYVGLVPSGFYRAGGGGGGESQFRWWKEEVKVKVVNPPLSLAREAVMCAQPPISTAVKGD